MEWLILFVIVLLVFYFKNYLKSLYVAVKLPGPHPFDPLGNIFVLNNIIKATERCVTKYGSCRLITFWITIFPFIILLDPQDIKLVTNNDKVTKKSNMFCNILKCVIGEGLVTNNGHQWKKNRKLIQAVFNMNVLETFTNTFFKKAQDVVELLKGKTDLNIVSYINQYVLRVAWYTILGISLSCDEGELQKRKTILFGHNKINHWTMIKALCNQVTLDKDGKLCKTDLQCFIKKLLESNTMNQQRPNSFKSLLDWLSEISTDNDEFTEEDVVNEASTFIHASYETVRSAIAYSLYCLAKHQDVQENVVQELDQIYDGDTGKETTIYELNDMKYLEQCIKESMRMYPSAPFFLREITQDVTLGEHVLPVGTNLVICPIILHRLPHLFPDPLKFDPERFSKENSSKIDPHSFIPFSTGPRNCIGYKYAILEMKTFIASLLRKYHISLVPGHEDLRFTFNVTLVAKGGIWLRLKTRKQET